MKRIIFLLIGIFILSFGCSDEILDTNSALETANLKSANTKMIPTKGEVFISVDEYNAQGFGQNGKMSGYFSHMGKLDETKSTWVNLSHDFSQYPPMITIINDVVFCAANGDLLYASYTGHTDVTTSEVFGIAVFEGGTGRFINASGQTSVDGYAWYDEFGRVEGMYLAGEGEISNVGSAKSEKLKTFQVRGHVEAIPNLSNPTITCIPAEYDVILPGSGWVNGHKNIFGKFVQDESFFERDLCELNMTPEGPVVYSHANVELTSSDGDKIFVESHSWVNAVTGDVSGYNVIKDGTGRFKDAYGESDIINGTFDPETGITSWDEDGYITLVLKEK